MELEIALASVRNSSARPGTDRPQTVENRPDPLLRHVARRTVLQAFAAAVAASPLGRLGIFAQAPPITDAQVATLRAIAEVVLPSAVGRDERDRVVNGFVAGDLSTNTLRTPILVGARTQRARGSDV